MHGDHQVGPVSEDQLVGDLCFLGGVAFGIYYLDLNRNLFAVLFN